MDRLDKYYREHLIFNPNSYIAMCEEYDVGISLESSFDLYVFDNIYYDYKYYLEDKKDKLCPIWNNITPEEIENIREYIINTLIELHK